MRRTAASLQRRARWRKALPALLAFTDPARTPDPGVLVRSLTAESALVFRAFDAPDAAATADRLLKACRARGVKLLIGADHRLAAAIGADGVHLPERLAWRARAIRRPGWIVTAAAHSERAAHLALAAGADAAVVSAVFPSRSLSAGAPMGPVRMAQLARRVGGPVYALGGVNNKTARRLLDADLVGIAAVEGVSPRT